MMLLARQTAMADNHGWHSHVLEFVAVGTAVSPITDAAHELHAEARTVLSVRDD